MTPNAFADIGVGLLGPGAVGECHAQTIAALGARLAAVAGPRSDQNADFAARHGVARTYTDVAGLVADPEVDVVVVASPSAAHADQAVAALEAGKDVLCEVPVGLTLSDARRVASAAATSGRRAMAAHTLRFGPAHRRIRAEVESGDLVLTHVIGRTLTLRQHDVGWTGRVRDWSDNVLWHHGAHLVDAALWFLDASDADVHGGCGPPWPASGAPMDVGAVLRTPRGQLATLSLSFHARIATNDFLLIAEDRTLELRAGRLSGPDGLIVDAPDPATALTRAIESQDLELLMAIADDRQPHPTVADVLPTMRVLQTLENGRR